MPIYVKYDASTPGIDSQALQPILLRAGVTAGGAHQFMEALQVSSADDRIALRGLLLELLGALDAASPLLHSALLHAGVTPLGARQFMGGLPVGNQQDRNALQEIVVTKTTDSASTGLFKLSLWGEGKKVKIDF